jgi:uncharacterized membrane protein
MSTHPALRAHADGRTIGERLAERMADGVGSWPFLIGQNLAMAAWMAVNVLAVALRWDPYPFILLNLMLSCQAAETGPILLIAAKRAAARDRALAEHSWEQTVLIHELLEQNTTLTRQVHAMTAALHGRLLREDA